MKAIHIDFAPHSPGQVIASMRPVHWLLAGIGFALCVGGMVALHDLTQRQAARQAELEQIQAQQVAARSATSTDSRKPAIPEAQASAVNSAIQQLNLPWSRLLTAIERATPSSVALLELVPDAKRHLVKGMAEAKTSGTMLAYITHLKQQPFMGNVILIKHEISDQDTNRPLRFEFEAEWLEAGQ
jgi:Tfp pilus assembly protein PilN